MNPLAPVIRRRKGPITRAIDELDQRTRAMSLRGGPGVYVAATPTGTVVTVSPQPQISRNRSTAIVWL